MFPSHSSGRQARGGQPVPEALCQNRGKRLSISTLLLHACLQIRWPKMLWLKCWASEVAGARCQNSAKHLSISASDLHFVFTLSAAESLSKHSLSLSSCEIIDILSAPQCPFWPESRKNTEKYTEWKMLAPNHNKKGDKNIACLSQEIYIWRAGVSGEGECDCGESVRWLEMCNCAAGWCTVSD